MLKDKLTRRLLLFFVGIVLVEVFVLNTFVSFKLSEYSERKATERLKSNALLLRDTIGTDIFLANKTKLNLKVLSAARKIKTRLTVVDLSGKVLADTDEAPELMENHADRPEIIQAYKGVLGQSTRISDTLNKSMKYLALPLFKGEQVVAVLRLSIPLERIEEEIRHLHQIVLLGAALSAVLAFIIGYFISRHITKPILSMKESAKAFARGDFSHKIKIKAQDELGELAGALNHMAGELEEQIQELRMMDKIKTDLVANVSHELKTPLTSIKGFVETLEDGALEDPVHARRFLSIIGRHADRLGTIVDDLLTLSVIENSKNAQVLSKELFDFKELSEEIVIGLKRALQEKQQEIKLDFKTEDNYMILADRMRIEEVLVNLISNAIRYTPESSLIVIKVTATRKYLQCQVIDNGPGIAKEHHERIFERFYTVDKARSREVGGTGLGLSIVKHIVLAHKGKIFVESTKGQGTTMIFTVPRAKNK